MLSPFFFFYLSCWSHCPLEPSKICSTTEPRNWILFLAFHHHPVYPYHWKGPQKVLLPFWPALWKAALFCLDTDFAMVCWFLICVPGLTPGADLTRHPETQPTASWAALSFTQGLWGLRKLLHRISPQAIKTSSFFIMRMTLELKDTFQARLLILRSWSLVRGRNLLLPN